MSKVTFIKSHNVVFYPPVLHYQMSQINMSQVHSMSKSHLTWTQFSPILTQPTAPLRRAPSQMQEAAVDHSQVHHQISASQVLPHGFYQSQSQTQVATPTLCVSDAAMVIKHQSWSTGKFLKTK